MVRQEKMSELRTVDVAVRNVRVDALQARCSRLAGFREGGVSLHCSASFFHAELSRRRYPQR